MSGGQERWTEVARWGDLPADSLTPIRRGALRVLLVRGQGDALHAVENRCPHEGYALSQGYVQGHTLTCAWHNWKFDLRDGSCLLGEEGVRSFPVRVVGGRVEVDLQEPDPARFQPGWWKSLREGLSRHELGRVLREGVRLVQSGVDPWRLLFEAVREDAARGEWGTTHVLPLAADCGRLLGRYPGAEALVPVAPVLRACGEFHARLPERPLAPALPGGTAQAFRAAVEGEDGDRAEGLVLGALEAGATPEELDDWLWPVLADHFTDFGHPLIYHVKYQELRRHAPAKEAARWIPAMVRGLVLATREDTLPYLTPYFQRWAEKAERRAEVWETARRGPDCDPVPIRDAVLDGDRAAAFQGVWRALKEGASAGSVTQALVGAAAHRVLRFDQALESDPAVAENWLWATHRLTFAAAVRQAVTRWQDPRALDFLVQSLAFVHSGRGMDAAPAPEDAQSSTGAGVEDVCEAIRRRDPKRAVALARAVLDGGAVEPLRLALEDLTLGDLWVRPIYQAHAVKTVVAAFEEAAAMDGHPDQQTVRLAAVRFVASPVCEGRLQGTVRTSIEWAAHGRMPRKLTQ